MGWIKKGYKKLYVAVNLYPRKQKIDDAPLHEYFLKK